MQLFSGNLHGAERREWPGNLHKADLPVGVTWTKNQDIGPGDKSQKHTTDPQPLRQNRDTWQNGPEPSYAIEIAMNL